MNSIYGDCESYLPTILQTFIQDIEEAAANYKKETNLKLYEHLHARIKTKKVCVKNANAKAFLKQVNPLLKKYEMLLAFELSQALQMISTVS